MGSSYLERPLRTRKQALDDRAQSAQSARPARPARPAGPEIAAPEAAAPSPGLTAETTRQDDAIEAIAGRRSPSDRRRAA